MKSKKKFKVIGVMSGTSLDGLDIAYCKFQYKKSGWKFKLEAAETLPYNATWRRKLSLAYRLNGGHLGRLDHEFGNFIGMSCKTFIRKNKIGKIDLISSHGHTVFHQPQSKFTLQIGNGNSIHSLTGIQVVYDFRSLDVALHGEGAPLVPIGDSLLFGKYDLCLNLGGVSNISLRKNGKRNAFDIGFANMGLNFLSELSGKRYDENGQVAAAGKINRGLLSKLNGVYSRTRSTRPSLGRELFEKSVQPLLLKKGISLRDKMRTWVESVVTEVALAIPEKRKKSKMLITGGGAHNKFLISRLKKILGGYKIKMAVPKKELVDFKEAIVFGFLGVLKVSGEVNVLKSVTGAYRDSSSGVVVGESVKHI